MSGKNMQINFSRQKFQCKITDVNEKTGAVLGVFLHPVEKYFDFKKFNN